MTAMPALVHMLTHSKGTWSRTKWLLCRTESPLRWFGSKAQRLASRTRCTCLTDKLQSFTSKVNAHQSQIQKPFLKIQIHSRTHSVLLNILRNLTLECKLKEETNSHSTKSDRQLLIHCSRSTQNNDNWATLDTTLKCHQWTSSSKSWLQQKDPKNKCSSKVRLAWFLLHLLTLWMICRSKVLHL